MSLPQKLTAFAMTSGIAIMWVLAGLSAGGVALALGRAIGLLRTNYACRLGAQ
jgi:hypothetical protein